MKILTLDLKAFGRFKETSLDLSGGHYGLHIVYGLNETGKSTALRALEALFYGIEHQTRDNFLHGNQNLRIGGIVRHSDRSELAFVRRKGNKNTLLDTKENPMADSVLDKYIGGVTQEQFHTLFGINHETLRRGGMQLVAGGGDLGESLFAAGTGITDLRNIAQSLQNEAQETFKPRGSTQLLNILITNYKNAKKNRNELSLSSREWGSHEKTLNEAKAKREKIRTRLKRLRSDKGRLERLKEALPIITEKKELSTRLYEFKDTPLLDPSFPDERRNAIRELEKARSDANKATEDLGLIERQIKDMSVPEDIISHAKVITELHKRLGSHLKAGQDLPGIRGKWEALQSDAKKILTELRPGLGLNDVEALRLIDTKRVMIHDLGGTYQSFQDESTRTSEALEELEADYARAKENLKKLEAPLDADELRSTLRRIQKSGDLEKESGTARSRLETEEKQGDIALKALQLWTGTLEDLEALSVPSSESIDRFLLRFDNLGHKIRDTSDRIRENQDEGDNFDAQIKALRIAGSVPTEQELIKERKRRDRGWDLVRRAWLENEDIEEESKAFDPEEPLDKAYEKSLHQADEIADRLRREAKRVEKLAQLLASRDKCVEKLEASASERDRLLHEQDNLGKEWDAHWEETGIKPQPPKEMIAWLRKQEQLVNRGITIRECRRDVMHIERIILEHAEDLGRCLRHLGKEEPSPDQSLNAILDRCQIIIDEIEGVTRRRNDVEKEINDIKKRRAAAMRKKTMAQRNLEEWYESWGKAIIELGLPVETIPNQANAFISATQKLFEKVDKADELNSRMEGIRRDAKQFETEVRGLLGQVAPDLIETPIYQSAEELNARLVKAREDFATLKELRKRERGKVDTMLEARATIRETTGQLKAMCQKAGCSDYGEMEKVEFKSAEKSKLEDLIMQLESQLQRVSHGGGLTTDELIRDAEGVNPDDLPVLIEDLEHTIEEEQNQLSDLDNTIGGEERELMRMDGSAGAAEAAEEAEGILSGIRDHTERYMHLRMASAILSKEIERYREANQDPILRRAGAVFSQLTSGSFSGLKPSYDDRDNPILLGVRSTGEEVTVTGMSDGTCDQLYLSLRLASLEKHMEESESMPFIIDDILINFDDNRAEATLQVLAELSENTQVIFFTHHRHLVELAETYVTKDALFTHSLSR